MLFHISRFAAAAVLVATLSACAAPPSRPRVVDSSGDPPLAAGFGRLYFYRTTLSLGGSNSILGTAERPVVMLDHVRVAEGLPGAVFFCDLPPGHHAVTVRAQKDYPLSVDVPAGINVYVKMDWGLGGLVGQNVLEVPPPTAVSEVYGRMRIPATCPA